MMRQVVLAVLIWYQKYMRRLFPASCRFTPSCSEYAREAIVRYGCFKGGAKALKRILRCHPFSGRSGYDPVS
ncbi:MAG TPA: membrane protein insertion efficiency factor YidD [Candidatus Omnitrophota bacterium]|nr:membrane protein insertion efficiency factor YidD [Candidatus Omnitrophota bacterium]HPT07186.1 membrane protein insertion efficiency factor YidD [Candidatus Omnitrophota bacterium]